MACDIARRVFRTLAGQGVTFDRKIFASVLAAFARMAGEAIRFSAADAEVNGLRYDGQQEEIAAATFAGSIRLAANDCLLDPTGDPMIPDWDRVESVLPEFLPDLLEAVQSDNRG